jgi:histidinol phosphatase-like enzyme (inositol monophosphatase family)
MVSTREYLDFATDAAFQAGQLTLAHFQTGVAVDRKRDASPVTVADRGGEELLRALIGKRFPDHGLYGEEMGESENDSTHRWIIDPIDGTQSFIRGVPLYGVLLGLEIDAEMVVGVCYLPALGEMLAAGRDEGCRWNGREARVSEVDVMSAAVVSLTEPGSLDEAPHGAFWQKLKRAARVVRGYSDCYGHCLVATGRCEIMLDPIMNPWDCAALMPIVEEAGGTFTDWRGERTVYGGSAMSTNGVLFDALMELKA